MIRLEVHDGHHRRILTADGDLVRIGRDPSCEVQLPGDLSVSRFHASLRPDDNGWVVEDASSRNGTFVNGRRLAGPHRLGPTDRVLIGNVVLVMHHNDVISETVGPDPSDPRSRPRAETGLSAREVEVLRLVCAGSSDQEIASELVLSVKTVHSHLDRIRAKTGCRRRVELVRFAMEHGFA